MDALFVIGAFSAGVAFGFPLGRLDTVKVLGPLIRKMSTRILELEEKLIDSQKAGSAEVEDPEVEERGRCVDQAFEELGYDAPLCELAKRAREIQDDRVDERLEQLSDREQIAELERLARTEWRKIR